MEKDNNKTKYHLTREVCLQNAEDFISASEKLDGCNLEHIRYHLDALALEEIGKAELIEMANAAGLMSQDTTYEINSIDNHKRKLFMAFWGITFGKKIMDKNELEQLQNLATSIHSQRLDTLYVKSTDIEHPKLKLKHEDVDQIHSLAKARLEMEKAKTLLDPDDPSINKDEMRWFLTANEDPEKYRLIFGKKSQEKLIEIGNVRDWIHWVKEQFDNNDAEIKKVIEEELHREKPKSKESINPKYKVRVRINSESHSIRSKEFTEWNRQIDIIKLYADNKNKNDLLLDIYLQKAVPMQGSWFLGWGIARSFVAALNIATKGFFWWHVPKDRSRFYEDMWDLERNMRMGVEQNPKLSVNFKDLHWVLKDTDLNKTSAIFYYITKCRGKKEEEPLNEYVGGLSFLAKNDIHLRLELNAYDQFYKALKKGMEISQDWDGKSDFKTAAHKFFDKLSDFENLDEVVDIGEELQRSPTKSPTKPVTLTEVFAVKMFCELYLEIIAMKSLPLKT